MRNICTLDMHFLCVFYTLCTHFTHVKYMYHISYKRLVECICLMHLLLLLCCQFHNKCTTTLCIIPVLDKHFLPLYTLYPYPFVILMACSFKNTDIVFFMFGINPGQRCAITIKIWQTDAREINHHYMSLCLAQVT